MADRDKLLRNFVDAALELMKEGLSDLPADAALALNAAQNAGGDVVMVFSPAAGNVTVALHMEGSDADPIPLFRIQVPVPEGMTN